MPADKRFAVLIDADNISDRYIKIILDETSSEGEATYKRIYGDWTKPALGPWKKVLLENSITPIQQFNNTTGKNSTDSAMIIDAMDILYSGRVDGFCLCSSDSDFTRLASRLRESGMAVIGMGEQKTPKAFISACNKFKYLDILAGNSKKAQKDARAESKRAAKKNSRAAEAVKAKGAAEAAKLAADARAAEASAASEKIKAAQTAARAEEYEEDEEDTGEITSLEDIRLALIAILNEESDEDGWVSTSDLGNRLLKRFSDFDVRNYGFSKLTPFLKSIKGFEMKSVRFENSSTRQVFLREYIPDRDQQ